LAPARALVATSGVLPARSLSPRLAALITWGRGWYGNTASRVFVEADAVAPVTLGASRPNPVMPLAVPDPLSVRVTSIARNRSVR
jgi:hypothetical protein